MTRRLRSLLRWLRDRWLWLAVIVVIAAGLGGWQLYQKQQQTTAVKTEKPTRETIEQTIQAAGIVEAERVARLRFLAGGKVVYVKGKEGDYVKKGQTIATIDRATLQKQLEQNLNNFMKERYDWEGYNENNKDKASTNAIERTTNQNQLDLDNSVLNVEIQDIAIRNTALAAPFAGVITTMPTVVPGAQLTPTDYFEIIDPESIQFRARIDEADIAKIREGQQSSIELDAYPDQFINTLVGRVGFKSVETGSGTQFEVIFPIPSSQSYPLRLGMNGDATIKLGQSENALTVPLIATRTRSGKTYVDIQMPDGMLEEREIETGIETDDRIEVRSGLTETDNVVIPE